LNVEMLVLVTPLIFFRRCKYQLNLKFFFLIDVTIKLYIYKTA